MVLPVVDEERELLVGPTGGVVELDALVELHRAVVGAEGHEERRVERFDVVEGRVRHVGVHVFPRRHAHPALADLEDASVGAAASPVDGVVHRHHVGERRARHRRRKDVGLRDGKRGLVSAPGVTYEPDPRRVHRGRFGGSLHARHDGVDRRVARIPRAVRDVGLEDNVPLLRERGGVVRMLAGGHHVVAGLRRAGLVDVGDHRVRLLRVVVRRVEERPLQLLAVRVAEGHEIGAAPGVVVLERVGTGHLSGVGELGAGPEVIGGVLKVLHAVGVDAGGVRLGEASDHFRLPHATFRRSGERRRPGVAVLLGPLVVEVPVDRLVARDHVRLARRLVR